MGFELTPQIVAGFGIVILALSLIGVALIKIKDKIDEQSEEER